MDKVDTSQLDDLRHQYFAQIMSNIDETYGATVTAVSTLSDDEVGAVYVDFIFTGGDPKHIALKTIIDTKTSAQQIEVAWKYGNGIEKNKIAKNDSQLKKFLYEVCRDTQIPAVDHEVIYERRYHQRRPKIVTLYLQYLGFMPAWERRDLRHRNKAS